MTEKIVKRDTGRLKSGIVLLAIGLFIAAIMIPMDYDMAGFKVHTFPNKYCPVIPVRGSETETDKYPTMYPEVHGQQYTDSGVPILYRAMGFNWDYGNNAYLTVLDRELYGWTTLFRNWEFYPIMILTGLLMYGGMYFIITRNKKVLIRDESSR